MNQLLQIKHTTLVLLGVLLLGSFAIPQSAQAVSPPPDGGYAGGNTAEGQNALLSLAIGGYNTAVGFLALRSNTTSSFNTALGAGALLANTVDNNTATGAGALLNDSTGSDNTANGAFALFFNIASGNTAVGSRALLNNTTGGTLENIQGLILGPNVAVGEEALESNMVTSANTAVGYQALHSFTSGPPGIDEHAGLCTAVGFQALANATSADSNTAIGYAALRNCTTGESNTALGFLAGLGVTTANSVICIGAPGENVEESCYIGNIAGSSVDPVTASAVFVQNNGKLGTVVSSRRFKRDIKPMDKASEAILALRPVAFHYKSDPKNTPCFGLIAEDVAKADPDLVVRDKDGELLSVRYDQVNAMLLNEFLKARHQIDAQQKQIEALTAGLQKVSAQLQVSKAASQTVLNNR
jgi:hypothetical protein